MNSVRKGLRAGDLHKDTYGRLECSDCGEALGKRDDPDKIGSVRVCPNCGREWKQLK